MSLQRVVQVASLLTALTCSTSALADWRTHRGANVRFHVPNGWQETTRGEVLRIRPPGGGLIVEFIPVTTPQDVARTRTAVEAVMGTTFQNIHPAGAAQAVTINGLQGAGNRGTATFEGNPVEWFAIALFSDASHGVVTLGFAQQGQFESNRAVLRRVINSIQPSNTPNVMPFAGAETYSFVFTSPPGIPPRQNTGTGTVNVRVAGPNQAVIELLDEDGGPPCVLQATRAVANTATINPNQTCTNANGAVSFNVTGGTATFSGNNMVLSVSGAVQLRTPRGVVSGSLTYQFNGVHP